MVFVDADDTIIGVHGHAKQGAGFGYSGVRGLNALLATVSAARFAPVVIAQPLRKGSTGSPRGAKCLVIDALATVRRTHLAGQPVLVQADSALCRCCHGIGWDGAVIAPRRSEPPQTSFSVCFRKRFNSIGVQ